MLPPGLRTSRESAASTYDLPAEEDQPERPYSVHPYIDNTSALHVAGNRTYYPPRAKHIALRYFVQELGEDGTVTIHYVKKQDQLVDHGTKHPNKQRLLKLITKIRDFGP